MAPNTPVPGTRQPPRAAGPASLPQGAAEALGGQKQVARRRSEPHAALGHSAAPRGCRPARPRPGRRRRRRPGRPRPLAELAGASSGTRQPPGGTPSSLAAGQAPPARRAKAGAAGRSEPRGHRLQRHSAAPTDRHSTQVPSAPPQSVPTVRPLWCAPLLPSGALSSRHTGASAPFPAPL